VIVAAVAGRSRPAHLWRARRWAWHGSGWTDGRGFCLPDSQRPC
jgi:hypothetical protein